MLTTDMTQPGYYHKTTKITKQRYNPVAVDSIISSVKPNDPATHRDAKKFEEITDLSHKLSNITLLSSNFTGNAGKI